MKSFLIRRILSLIPVILGVMTLTFMLIHFIPGDPVDAMLGDQASHQEKQEMRTKLGLDRPLFTQYKEFMFKAIKFDFGTSILNDKDVLSEIKERVPASAELAGGAMFIALFVGIPLGIFAAVNQYRWPDHLILALGLLGMSVPAIIMGPLLTSIFSLKLYWLPVSERGGFDHLILPSLTFAGGLVAILMRMTRTSMLEVIHEDYIRTARAKGLSSRTIYFKHALRNALPPILTIVGLLIGALLTGVVVVETLYDWPGLGSLLLNSILQRDYPMVQGCTLFVAVVYMTVNLLTDISYAIVNPKVRLE